MSTTNYKRLEWLTVLVRSAKLSLAYQRSRASHPLIALRAFMGDQLAFFLRLPRLGPSHHIQLARLEIECAHAGLGYANKGSSHAPPWRLPESFAGLPASDLPQHPLIDAAYLSQIVITQPGAPHGALHALRQLLSPDGLSSRWAGVPKIGKTPVSRTGDAKVAVCLHLFYPDLWPTLCSALENIPEPWDLYVSVPAYACTPSLAQIAKEHPNVWFLPCANRGRDVLPFLRWLEMGIFDRYDAVCKLHSKRSPHMKDGERWLAQIMSSLVGSIANVSELLERIRMTPEIGLIGSRELLIDSKHPLHRSGNSRGLTDLATRANLPKNMLECPFFAGTMFWFRPPALARLRGMYLKEEDFPIEMAQTDGTLAHALERLIGPLAVQAGYRLERTNVAKEHGDIPAFTASH